MHFCHRLKVLLWKNWILRKRNKLRSVVEVLWPLFMILLVVLLHNLGEKHTLPNCHFKAKAMPTAGGLMFMQTILCALNNTCDAEKNATSPCYNGSIMSDIGDAIQVAFNLTKTKMNFRSYRQRNKKDLTVKNWVKDILINDSLISTIKMEKKKMKLSDKPSLSNHTAYSCSTMNILKLENEFEDVFLNNFTQSLRNDSKEIERTISDLLALSRARQKMYKSDLLQLFHHLIKKGTKRDTEVKNLIPELRLIDNFFCGPNVPGIMSQVTSLLQSGKRENMKGEETINPTYSNHTVDQNEWENDTTIFCNILMKKLENSYPLRLVFRLFKPLLRGKVIYTPEAPVTNRIMSKINATFLQVKHIIDSFKKDNTVPEYITHLDYENILDKLKKDDLFLQKIVESEIGKTIIKNFTNFQEDIRHNINIFRNYIDETIATWKELKHESISSKIIPFLECIDANRIIPMKDEPTAVKEALYWSNRERLWGLIVFQNVSSDAENLPPSLSYKIRTGIERTPDTNRLQDRVYVPKVRRNIIYDLREITGGLAYLQNIIEGELIREYTGRKHIPGIYLKQTPYPCHTNDSFRGIITRTFPMFMIISWIFIFCMVSKRIVAEKEVLFKGTLSVFGVTNTEQWISWFIDAFVPMTFVTTIMSILLVKGGLIPNSSIFVVWMFLTAFTLPTITLSFLVSTFFFKSSLAIAVSGMIYFLLYLPYPSIQNFGEVLDPDFKIITCLISNVAFGLGCTWIANMEELGLGATLDRMNYSPVAGNPITMCLIIEMFLVDSVLYMLLTIYFDNMFDGSGSIKVPWYYCIAPSHWKKNWGDSKKNLESDPGPVKDPRYFETDPGGLKIGIEVINVSKIFGKGNRKKQLVRNLTINFYEDQITSLLGHNGAGKTTAISMMIGLLPITEGTVRIYGVDIENHSHRNTRNIGICRQENVLLGDLTVEEHFKLFAKLRSGPTSESEADIKSLIDDLQLGHRAKQPVKILSGGMKRKVCVAMAFIGGCRTVFLDEPTAGIDPHARRSIWELLIKYKKGRTIVLTTHFLDEADILSDRIAIISSGGLLCCGSSMFLKSNFGRGYYLTIETNIRFTKTIETDKKYKNSKLPPQIEELSELIKEMVPGAEFFEQITSQIVFILPFRISHDRYGTLFTKLNDKKSELNIVSFGVNDTSLEEVFIKILEEAVEIGNSKRKEEGSAITNERGNTSKNVNNETYGNISSETRGASFGKERRRTAKIIMEHFVALMIKRFLHHKRNFKLILIEIFLPTFFMAIALSLSRALPRVTEMPPIPIDMSAYGSSSIFYTNEAPDNQNISAYEETLLSSYGLGTKCVLFPEKCSLSTISKGSLLNYNKITEASNNCSCSKGFFECLNNKELNEPPHSETSEGFMLYNLTGLNLTNWLLTTEFKYSPKRFGGISFGHFSPWTGISIQEFWNLFMFEKFTKVLDNISFNSTIIDPEALVHLIMSVSCNRTYGEEIYKDRDLMDNVIIWFNNRGWISSLAMMNGVTNLILRASLPNGSDVSKYSIRFINHPLPIAELHLEDHIQLQTNIALLCALSVIWALSFTPAMYAVYLVEEKISGLKNLQIVSGLNRTTYWMANLIWDLASYSISILFIIILYFLFQMTAFVGKNSIATFIVLFYSYGFVNIAFVYVISFGFSVPSTAFIFIACWNILSGVGTLLSVFTLSLMLNKENPYYLNDILIVFPQFCFGKSLVNMGLEGIRKASLENLGLESVTTVFCWDSTLKYIVVMLTSGIIFFIITLLMEYRIFQKLQVVSLSKIFSTKFKNKNEDQFLPTEEDDDVKRERERVEAGTAKNESDVLVINNLTKIYSRREPPVVDHICVGLRRGECFGLLGLNGAGKTTVFKMLTGSVSINEGDATIGGFSIKANPLKAEHLLGYCPQMNALDPYLTVEEHLSLFCRIRGVTGQTRRHEITSTLQRLSLTDHRTKMIKIMSGGDKRKVSTALALVCNPELILLDEPTSGMDILSRRFLWHCLQNVMQEGRSIVLTSHSMEECEALCTHISVMVKGRFSCFGSCQHLKNKGDKCLDVVTLRTPTNRALYVQFFPSGSERSEKRSSMKRRVQLAEDQLRVAVMATSILQVEIYLFRFNQGYSILIQLPNTDAIESVTDFLEKNLSDSFLLYIHNRHMKYKTSPNVFIGTIFNIMNRAKKENLIQGYSITQTTLEDIFLKLADSAEAPKAPESKFKYLKKFCCT